MIRQAETKDIPVIIKQLGNLLAYLKDQGIERFTDDQNQYVGGIIEYIALKMNNPNHVILTDGNGILIGMVEPFPGFMKHRLVGVLEYVYPLAFSSTPLAKVFYAWAKDKGATAIICLADIENKEVLLAYKRQGFNLSQVLMTREL